MIKIKGIILPGEDSDIEHKIDGILDEESRLLFIKKENNIELLFNLVMRFESNQIVLIGTKNEHITISDIQFMSKYGDSSIFKTSLIGVNCNNLSEIDDLTEIRAKIRLNPKKQFNFSEKSISFTMEGVGEFILNNKYIKIRNAIFNESKATSWMMKIMEFVALLIGEFPEIEYFEFKSNSNGTIKKYFDIDGLTDTELFFSSNNEKIVNFNTMHGKTMKKAFSNYCELIENDDIQLRTFFMSQSSLSRFTDYILTYILQAIEGFSRFAFDTKINRYSKRITTKTQLEKNKVKNVNEEMIKKEQNKYNKALAKIKQFINDNFENNILERLNGWFEHNDGNTQFNVILKYWLEKDKIVMEIFKNEIIESTSNNNINKEMLIKKTENERNRISHSMKKSKRKKYFTHEERVLYIKKYTLMFRYIVLKKVGLKIEELPTIEEI